MGQFVHNGVTYEELPDGNVRVVGYADSASPAVVAPNAARVAQQGLETDIKRGQLADQGRDAVLDQGKIATLPYDQAIAEANARKAAAEAAEAERKANKAKEPEQVERARAELLRMIGKIDTIAADADDNGGWFETGASGSRLRDFAGTPAYSLAGDLKTLDANAAFSALQEMRQNSPTGGALGGIAVKELELLKSTVSNLDPNLDHETFLRNLGEARRVYSDMVDRLPKADGRVDKTRPTYGAPPASPRVELSRDGTRSEADPTLRAFSGKLGKMIASGASDKRILEAMRASGINPQETSVDQALAFRRRPEWQEWKRQNPNKPYPIGPSFYSKEVPLTPGRALTNAAAQSMPGAFAIEAGNAVTGGNLDRIAGAAGGDPEMVNLGLQLTRTNNPGATFVGDMAGSALATAVPGAALSRAGRFAPLAADLLYGAVRGEGEEGGVSGAIEGAATNGLGGMFGRAITRGAGRALRGVRDPDLRLLNDADVPLTIGQIAGRGGQGGVTGRFLKGAEDKLENTIPFTGDMVRTRRMEGIEGFDRAAFREAGAPIGAVPTEIGERGNEQLTAAGRQAYSDALTGVRVAPDAQFFADAQPPIAAGTDLPTPLGDQFAYTGRKIGEQFDASGTLTGSRYQAARQTLTRDRKAVESMPNGYEFGQAARGVADSLEGLVRRQSPDTVPALSSADAAYRNQRIIGDAVSRARNAEPGGVFMPSQLTDAAEANAKRFAGSATTARPFFDLARAGQNVLPSRLPNSGTGDRLLFGSLLATTAGGLGATTGAVSAENGEAGQGAVQGGGVGLGTLATVAGLASIPYSRRGRNMIQRGLFARSPRVQRVGDMIVGFGTANPYGLNVGIPTSALGRDLTLLEELEQGEGY